ncbi:MAG: hypothetical protein AB7N65_00090 [Vicinamibacterales bacterium]
MKLDPDDKELLESFERGEWKPTSSSDVDRMGQLARQQLHVHVCAGLDSLARGEGRAHDPGGGRRLAERIKLRRRVTRPAKS